MQVQVLSSTATQKIDMSNIETIYDNQLNIRTTGRDDSRSDNYNYPYEPTNYEVLERVSQSEYFSKRNHMVDYGCGKGRVSYFLAYQTGCKAIGVEYDERLYMKAVGNLKDYPKPYNVHFKCCNAVDFEVPEDIDRGFFFNPFSVEVLMKVMTRIKESYYANPREILLFFYYPSDDYIAYLSCDDELMFEDEIDCRDMFEKEDSRERVMIFSLS